MQIRVFESADGDAVVQLWESAGLTRSWNNPRKDIARKLALQPELFLVAVAEDGRELCGTVMGGYDGHRGWLNYMAVSPQRQGQGVGRALLRALQALLLEMGCCKINLQVREGNEQALAFYRKLGFDQEPVISMGLRLEAD